MTLSGANPDNATEKHTLYAINNGATVTDITLAGGAGLGSATALFGESGYSANHHQMEPALPYRSVQMKVRP